MFFKAVCALGICTVPILLVFVSSSRGGRLYFSPDTYMAERQSELLLCKTEMPCYRSWPTAFRPKLASYLIESGYWKPRTVSHPKWLCVEHWNDRWRDGHGPLVGPLFGRDGVDWIMWSRTHPKVAEFLWPLIEQELRAGASDGRVVTIMLDAQQASDLDEFKRFLQADPDLNGKGSTD
jgi:hypothetical protein